jgi:hypothetical protein
MPTWWGHTTCSLKSVTQLYLNGNGISVQCQTNRNSCASAAKVRARHFMEHSTDSDATIEAEPGH